MKAMRAITLLAALFLSPVIGGSVYQTMGPECFGERVAAVSLGLCASIATFAILFSVHLCFEED